MYENNNKLAARQVMGKSLVGQTFYVVCPDDSRYYKTIHIRFNPFNALQPQMSNPVWGGKEDAENLGLNLSTRYFCEIDAITANHFI